MGGDVGSAVDLAVLRVRLHLSPHVRELIT